MGGPSLGGAGAAAPGLAGAWNTDASSWKPSSRFLVIRRKRFVFAGLYSESTSPAIMRTVEALPPRLKVWRRAPQTFTRTLGPRGLRGARFPCLEAECTPHGAAESGKMSRRCGGGRRRVGKRKPQTTLGSNRTNVLEAAIT